MSYSLQELLYSEENIGFYSNHETICNCTRIILFLFSLKSDTDYSLLMKECVLSSTSQVSATCIVSQFHHKFWLNTSITDILRLFANLSFIKHKEHILNCLKPTQGSHTDQTYQKESSTFKNIVDSLSFYGPKQRHIFFLELSNKYIDEQTIQRNFNFELDKRAESRNLPLLSPLE